MYLLHDNQVFLCLRYVLLQPQAHTSGHCTQLHVLQAGHQMLKKEECYIHMKYTSIIGNMVEFWNTVHTYVNLLRVKEKSYQTMA